MVAAEIKFESVVLILRMFDVAKAEEFYPGFLGGGVIDPFGNLIRFCEPLPEEE